MTMQKTDYVIVGAGIIGTAIAYALSQQGFSVSLIDGGRPGGQATNAAAGILSPAAEASVKDPFWDLTQRSLTAYEDFIYPVERESRMRVDYEKTGVFQIAAHAKDVPRLMEKLEWLQYETEAQWVDSAKLAQYETLLAEYPGAIFTPHEGQVHAPKLMEALLKAAQNYGTQCYFGKPVTAVSDEYLEVVMQQERVGARRGIIVATGAWTSLLGVTLGYSLPVHPIRGQILSLKSDRVKYSHICFMGHQYVVPKPDGRLVVGATEDVAGYDNRNTGNGIRNLSAIIEQFRLDTSDIEFDRVWAGLRPKTPDNLPVIGPLPGREHIFVASGHYRNGVLLTPITTQMVLAWAQTNTLPFDASCFGPERFATLPHSV